MKTKKSFRDTIADSPLIQQTEANVTAGLEEQTTTPAPAQADRVGEQPKAEKTASPAQPVQTTEMTVGCHAQIPMSLYQRMTMYKVNTRINFGQQVLIALDHYLKTQGF